MGALTAVPAEAPDAEVKVPARARLPGWRVVERIPIFILPRGDSNELRVSLDRLAPGSNGTEPDPRPADQRRTTISIELWSRDGSGFWAERPTRFISMMSLRAVDGVVGALNKAVIESNTRGWR